jgi:hypothetical protein
MAITTALISQSDELNCTWNSKLNVEINVTIVTNNYLERNMEHKMELPSTDQFVSLSAV